MDTKKIFDVTPPKTAEYIEATKSARKIMFNEPILMQDNSANPDVQVTVMTSEKVRVPRQELTVMPFTSKVEDSPTIDSETTKTATKDSEVKNDYSEGLTQDESDVFSPAAKAESEPIWSAGKVPVELVRVEEEKQEPVKELASFDSIVPDDSQRATVTAKDAMQSPTMYDTKAYYVPIGNSKHKHGHVLGTVLAGLVVAAIAVGGVIAASKFL